MRVVPSLGLHLKVRVDDQGAPAARNRYWPILQCMLVRAPGEITTQEIPGCGTHVASRAPGQAHATESLQPYHPCRSFDFHSHPLVRSERGTARCSAHRWLRVPSCLAAVYCPASVGFIGFTPSLTKSAAAGTNCRVPRQAGNWVHPRKTRLALRLPPPAFANLGVITSPHRGQRGVGAGFALTSPTARNHRVSLFPSINSMFVPKANFIASEVNTPDVTTNPPAAPFAAMTP